MKKLIFFISMVLFIMLIIETCKKSSPQIGTIPQPVVKPVNIPQLTAYKTLNYLYYISGKETLSGIHNREPNATPAVWTNQIFTTTGKYPAFWSGDFLFEVDNINNRQIMVNEAISEYGRGAIIQIMWHSCNPALSEPCGYDGNGVLSSMTDAQWNDLLTDGTAINLKWKSMVDEVCIYLQQLKDKKIEVFWRPYHEMNQSAFWWGGRPGANGTLKLYQQMHDYMTKTKGLTNLVWVWDLQDFSTLNTDVTNYNPGNSYWDMAALDVYDGSGYTTAKYTTMVNVASGKPIAIGECSTLPTAVQLAAQPKWTFFMSWSELTFSSNTNQQIISLYNSLNVQNLDGMPGW
jgi:mannan endo-1,4-beta-mannosidase